ncbi:MAG: UDP-N-acetylglucosamine--N-acetylmuramyl-(pentapeptide) pyrophosphoryl-undecaprenol N-acetylglucosamine transferase [Halobacteriovoraceae bacterium]|jgi:UDP-N-acetylglucosamine--N-acetylmuramyl-(pentapeptide) pyrophosphoryl-undecaprenol N-acetylglucosamine transferase|nr:UDP-N-acetylglucosamine--N-acetylmuramyl-(pentapeptide) pyrophosphoryl-undecaprenol N-acetylglucosamine transferase [Halobacteriovoraceae bacterium]MBT5093851.1 UDP-N-acetylglucosamine--N-acetylmuramyl-(pentapeptide) pyrophosphoryl-undecaprenol N-acetylglucosamine transferase [Halobacteriovoraceae bacterium]
MSNERVIIFTGGGSGGHVVPGLTLINELQKDIRNKIYYIGSHQGIERSLVENQKIPYYAISTGKLRRYLSLQNLLDIFKVFKGIWDAFWILARFKRNRSLVFSTGGFVSVPVVLAAWFMGKKVFIHEQTSQVGLANKICSLFAQKIYISFEDSLKFFPSEKTEVSGYPLREQLFNSSVGELVISGVNINDISKPILFITGGGNGSGLLNDLVKKYLHELSKKYFIVHQVGKNYIEEFSKVENENYLPLDFLNEGMIDLYKLSDTIISRAGAGTVCELLALNKKSIFIPLKIAQRNEQYFNALEAQKKLGSRIIEEDSLPSMDLLHYLQEFSNEDQSGDAQLAVKNGTEFLRDEIQKVFS